MPRVRAGQIEIEVAKSLLFKEFFLPPGGWATVGLANAITNENVTAAALLTKPEGGLDNAGANCLLRACLK